MCAFVCACVCLLSSHPSREKEFSSYSRNVPAASMTPPKGGVVTHPDPSQRQTGGSGGDGYHGDTELEPDRNEVSDGRR